MKYYGSYFVGPFCRKSRGERHYLCLKEGLFIQADQLSGKIRRRVLSLLIKFLFGLPSH